MINSIFSRIVTLKYKAFLFLAVALVFTAGCQVEPGTSGAPAIVGKVGRIKPVAVQSFPVVTRTIVGRSVENRPIMAITIGRGSNVTLVIGGIHGNEPAGVTLAHELADHLTTNQHLLTSQKVVIVPAANPDGLARNQRNNIHGVDLNRNFTAANRMNNAKNGRFALSEPESRTLQKLIADHGPNRIITIHQPLACIDYDGPGRSLAEAMAARCNLPVKKLGARPGSLGSYAGNTLGIPIITVELTRQDSRLSAGSLWSRYGKMATTAIEHNNSYRKALTAK